MTRNSRDRGEKYLGINKSSSASKYREVNLKSGLVSKQLYNEESFKIQEKHYHLYQAATGG